MEFQDVEGGARPAPTPTHQAGRGLQFQVCPPGFACCMGTLGLTALPEQTAVTLAINVKNVAEQGAMVRDVKAMPMVCSFMSLSGIVH